MISGDRCPLTTSSGKEENSVKCELLLLSVARAQGGVWVGCGWGAGGVHVGCEWSLKSPKCCVPQPPGTGDLLTQ